MSGKIHPTALIDEGAKLDPSVEVGPYTVIEKDVVIGKGTVISSCVRIYAGAIIGENNRIFHTAFINAEPQDLSFKPGAPAYTVIGNNNVFRENANVSGSANPERPTRMGNGNYFMCDTHLGHDCQMGDNNTVVQCSVASGHVTFGNCVVFGGASAIHQHVNIGDYAMIGGCSRIAQDVPPYAMVEGNPSSVIGLNTVGLKRANFSPEERKEIKETYRVIFHSGLNNSQAIAELRKRTGLSAHSIKVIEFFENSKRGVIDHR